jgi:sugar lactone lactonase YvrE
MENEFVDLDFDDETWETWLTLEPQGTGNRLNDGRCDRQGRFWVGSMHEDAQSDRFSGMLHQIRPGGGHRSVQDQIGISNGIAFSPDGKTMYFADTPRRTVWAYDYDPDSGDRSGQRVFTDFSNLPGWPDGACVDADGCYWISCVLGSAIARLTPEGELDRIVDLPVEKPTAAAFGGSDLDTLYVTSIGGDDGSNETTQGHLYAVDVGVRGLSEPVFG